MGTCATCRWGDLRESGAIYCKVNLWVHQYNPPQTKCNSRDLAGSLSPRWEAKQGK